MDFHGSSSMLAGSAIGVPGPVATDAAALAPAVLRCEGGK